MIYDTTIYFISNSYILYHQNTIQKTPYLDVPRPIETQIKLIIHDTIWVYEDYDLQTVDGRSFLNMDQWRSWETYNIIKTFQVAYMMGMTKGFQ